MAKLIKAEMYYILKAAYANNHDNKNTLCLWKYQRPVEELGYMILIMYLV